MSQTKVMYQRPITRDAISLRPARQPHERMLRKSKSTRSETISKLKTAYSHAARAFLHHRIEEAHTLVEEAFELLHPPAAQEHSSLSTYRRKWDILRITLETTLYTTPISGSSSKRAIKLGSIDESSSSSTTPIPQSPNGSISPRSKNPLIDDPLLLSPPSLLGTLHTRSLKLFTPSTDRPNSRFLPAPVLVALVLASLKLECPQVGRGMVDDWLANRESLGLGFDSEVQGDEREGYEKVIEVYSLHVLPRLNEWEYAKEFLESEMEMRPAKREELVATLAAHHAKSLLPPSPKPSQLHNIDNSVSGSSGAPTPRAVSPAPSSVSSHTAVPNSRSVATLLHNKSSLTSPSPLSPPSATTARQQRSANIASSSIVPTTLAIPPPGPTLAAQPALPAQPTVLQLLKAVLIPYVRRLNAPVVLLAIVLSFVGLASRFGRRPRGGSGADMARRRLAGGSGGMWAGLVDAVKMSGRGLV